MRRPLQARVGSLTDGKCFQAALPYFLHEAMHSGNLEAVCNQVSTSRMAEAPPRSHRALRARSLSSAPVDRQIESARIVVTLGD